MLLLSFLVPPSITLFPRLVSLFVAFVGALDIEGFRDEQGVVDGLERETELRNGIFVDGKEFDTYFFAEIGDDFISENLTPSHLDEVEFSFSLPQLYLLLCFLRCADKL